MPNYEFYPQDTDKKMYIPWEIDLEDLTEKVQEKWPDVKTADVKISTEYILIDHLSYDQYDSSDYMTFMVIEIE